MSSHVTVEVRRTAAEAAFERELIALIPKMRALARSLCGDRSYADDLAQEALAKALANRTSYQPGTNMKAWLFMILRNHFFSDRRQAWRSSQLDPRIAAETLLAVDDPASLLELDEVRHALQMVPEAQREALVMVAAGGLAYEEAAEVIGVPVGTIKSRVNRGRISLQRILDQGSFPRTPGSAGTAMGEIISGGRPAGAWHDARGGAL